MAHTNLTPDDQAWLDETPEGDRRQITVCGREYAVDRRVQSRTIDRVEVVDVKDPDPDRIFAQILRKRSAPYRPLES